MDEDDITNKILDELKDEGYKSFEERKRKRNLEQALRDYDRYLSCPYG